MPGRIKIAIEDNGAGSTINSFFAPSPTLQGHPGAAGAAAVGAAFYLQTPKCGTTPALLEPFSSAGGDPILFDATGTRLATAVVRQKPDFVAPDAVNNTFLGFVVTTAGNGIVQCRNNPQFPLFAGTSAATPHAAAAAALMLQSNPNATAAQVLTALRTSASPMGATPNFLSGYGFIQVDAALAKLPPAAPTISLSPTSITVGMSSTLTWSAVNVTGCTASGSWSGAQVASGTQTVTPMAAASLTYTLTCANAVGSANKSAVLSVQPAPSGGGGGGGGLDAAALFALGGLACARLLRRRWSTPS
jgi:subtilisin family serine protease